MLWTTWRYGWFEQLGILWVEASRCYKQHRAKDDMNDSCSWAYDPKCNEQLRVVDDMNDFGSWAQGFRGYEQLKIVVDMKNSESYAQGSRCYEQLRVLDDMNDSWSRDLRPLDGMDNSRLRITWMILGCQPMTLNDVNSLGLCMKWMTPGHELRTVVAMKNSRLWMIWMTTNPMGLGLSMLWKAQVCEWYEWFLVMCPWL